jgi:hypothetical protein
MPIRLFFLLLFCATATIASAQIEWNVLVGRAGGPGDYAFQPAANDFASQRVRFDGGWAAGLDVRIGGRKLFLVPGLRWQRLDYGVQADTGPAELSEYEAAHAQVLTLPLGVAWRLREAATSFNLNLHAGVYYQLELSQAEVLALQDRAPLAWHPDTAYGLRLGAGLDLDWLTLHLDYYPRLGVSDGFVDASGFLPRNLSIGVRF